MLSFSPSRKKERREDRAPAGTHRAPMRKCCTRNAQGRHRAAETRPSLRSGLTAYAVLSREPNSFWPPLTFAKFTTIMPVDAMTPSQKLDRSNDGQDHTVSPYAGNPASPEASQGISVVRHAQFVTRSRGSSRPARPIPHRRRPRPPHSPPALVTTYDRPFGGLGWPTHTTNPNFGKVEYFCDKGLTPVLPDG